MLLWVWIAVVVVALVILVAAAAPLLGKLGGLRRAAVKLQRRQQEALALQEKALVLQETVAQVEARLPNRS
ncbi:hypothetical protein ACIA5D_14970 [Actinoplanes sp. NPDC051513]|uniref:hypothetical protein n=1 Tax=Actinoplanes sp. NPDC051513 TaxID=3363908 RepID=UPI003788883A